MSKDPSVFAAVINPQGRIEFEFPAQQEAYCRGQFSGQCVDVIIAPQGHAKTRKQEQGLHAMIKPWADGEGHRIDDLKRDILRAVFGEQEHADPITGNVSMVLREPHTSKLNRAQYCELIERTLELGAECGVVLIAPDEYRRLKEQAQKRNARQAVAS